MSEFKHELDTHVLGLLAQHAGAVTTFWVAFSGGRDSTVLLDIVARSGALASHANIRAVHIHHGLHPEADHWAKHCIDVAQGYGVECDVLHVDAQPSSGESPEAKARAVRYKAMEDLIGATDILLTAHHRGDQAETVLLQLFRGSGPEGLAAMPLLGKFGRGNLLRPLLDIDSSAIQNRALEQKLAWIDDPSNTNEQFSRNFLRHRILPELHERWPGIDKVLARVARHQSEAAQLLAEIGRSDLELALADNAENVSIKRLSELPEYRQSNLLRCWFRLLGVEIPSAIKVERILREVITADKDRSPEVCWANVCVRRYRNELYMTPRLSGEMQASLRWDGASPLTCVSGVLSMIKTKGEGISASRYAEAGFTIGFRQGGETCRLPGSAISHSVKNLFQESGIPPWERGKTPFIYIDGELAAVPGLCICDPFQAAAGENGLSFEWLSAGLSRQKS